MKTKISLMINRLEALLGICFIVWLLIAALYGATTGFNGFIKAVELPLSIGIAYGLTKMAISLSEDLRIRRKEKSQGWFVENVEIAGIMVFLLGVGTIIAFHKNDIVAEKAAIISMVAIFITAVIATVRAIKNKSKSK